jgi:hypothetical protein
MRYSTEEVDRSGVSRGRSPPTSTANHAAAAAQASHFGATMGAVSTTLAERFQEALRHDLRWMLVMAAVSVTAAVLVITVDDTIFRVVWLFAALEAAWTSATFYQARQLARILEVFSEAVNDVADVPEREALLARLDDWLAHHPNLWPHVVPIVAAAIGVVGAVAVALFS